MISFYRYTDGGRENWRAERLDCSVRALAVMIDIPYFQAHDILKFAGRKDQRKAYGTTTADAYRLAGLDARKVTENGQEVRWITFSEFKRQHPTGRYLLRCRGHVFTVKDSIVYDKTNIGNRTRILNYWTIKGETNEQKLLSAPASAISR